MRRRGRCQTPKRPSPGAGASARTFAFRLSSGTRTLCTEGDVAKKRILFIDDRPDHLRQPVLRLQLAGYEVEEARSGAEGLAWLRQEPFDLLTVDAELRRPFSMGALLEAVRQVIGEP